MKISPTLLRILEADIASNNTVFLAGEPGIGKTSIVKSVAKSANSECFIVQVNQLADKADLTGARLVPTPDGKTFEQKFFAHHKVRAAVQYATDNPRTTVFLLLDEINRTTPDVTSGALSISTERELGDQALPDNLKIVVTGNIKGNVVALDSASLSRFSVYYVEPDAQTLVAHLDSRDNGTRPLNPMVKAVLVKNPQTVFEQSAPNSYTVVSNDDDDDTSMATFADLADASEEMLQLTTPRTIEAISDWLDEVEKNDPQFLKELFQTSVTLGSRDATLLHEVVEAHVGNTSFAKLLIGEIAGSFTMPQSQQQGSGVSVAKPGCWDALVGASTQSDLDAIVASLSDHEKSGSLVYAVYDRRDNSAIINQLVAQTSAVEPGHMTTFTTLMANSRLDQGNLSTLLQAGTPLTASISSMASLMGLI